MDELKDIAVPFMLPAAQNMCCFRQPKDVALPIDQGMRPADVVTHRLFRDSKRKKLLKAQEQDSHINEPLEPLKKDDFVGCCKLE